MNKRRLVILIASFIGLSMPVWSGVDYIVKITNSSKYKAIIKAVGNHDFKIRKGEKDNSKFIKTAETSFELQGRSGFYNTQDFPIPWLPGKITITLVDNNNKQVSIFHVGYAYSGSIFAKGDKAGYIYVDTSNPADIKSYDFRLVADPGDGRDANIKLEIFDNKLIFKTGKQDSELAMSQRFDLKENSYDATYGKLNIQNNEPPVKIPSVTSPK